MRLLETKQNMFKGRLLRQEAINLENDQTSGSTINTSELCHIGIPSGYVPETDNFIPGEDTVQYSTVKQCQSERAIPPQISDASFSLNRNEREKRFIFSKRIHSSPSNISKAESFNVTRRVHSADVIGFGDESSDVKGHSADNTHARASRTLEEAVKEFLLKFHNKRNESRTEEEKYNSLCRTSLDESHLNAESVCVKLNASRDVNKLPVVSKKRLAAFKGRTFFICYDNTIRKYKILSQATLTKI